MNRISEGLKATSNPARRDQAAGWRVFRARDTPDAAIYVVLVDPVVRRDISLVTLAQAPLSPATKALYDVLMRTVRTTGARSRRK